jgi:SAM-dependent methyltransferase
MTETAYSGVDNLEAMAALARNYNRFLVRQVERQCGGADRLVDFGAGTGTFSAMLRDRGRRVACVEADPTLNAQLRDQGFESHTSIEAYEPASLGAVFSLNVLEHIEDDAAVMAQVFSRLKPGGVFYVYVPAFGVLFSSMDEKVGHFRRYTKAMMLPRLRGAGFAIRRARYADSLGFAASLAFKWFGNKEGDLNPRGLVLYDRVAFPLSRALDLVAGPFAGKNLAVTAVKAHGA